MADKKTEVSKSEVDVYIEQLSASDSAICKLLKREIQACLPKGVPKFYHSSPIWFIGENAVVGFRVTDNNGVNLLFWNGQALAEPELKAVGKFKTAQIQFRSVKEIDLTDLRRWLKKAGKDILEFANFRKQIQS